jgi:hypothetical protein
MLARTKASIEAPIARRTLAHVHARQEIPTSRGFWAIAFPLHEPAVVATAPLLVQRMSRKAEKCQGAQFRNGAGVTGIDPDGVVSFARGFVSFARHDGPTDAPRY